MVLISPSSPRPRGNGAQDHTTDIALIGDDLYSIMSTTQTLGYVYKTGTVFVSLSGSDFARAVEIGQSLSWEHAIEIVRSH